MKLLTIENAKTNKGTKLGYLTGILYLAPHNIAGYGSICKASTVGCRAACLYTAGRGAFKSIQQSRIIKTIHLFENRQGFIEQLQADISALIRKATKLGLKPAVRLNGTSDLNWQLMASNLFTNNLGVQFYDYTKHLERQSKFANYDLSYSLSECWTQDPDYCSKDQQQKLSDSDKRLVVVFDKLPQYYMGREVISGDEHDLRFLDRNDVVIGLIPKGKAKKDLTGFVERHG